MYINVGMEALTMEEVLHKEDGETEREKSKRTGRDRKRREGQRERERKKERKNERKKERNKEKHINKERARERNKTTGERQRHRPDIRTEEQVETERKANCEMQQTQNHMVSMQRYCYCAGLNRLNNNREPQPKRQYD